MFDCFLTNKHTICLDFLAYGSIHGSWVRQLSSDDNFIHPTAFFQKRVCWVIMPDLKSQKLLCVPACCQHFNAQADSFLRWGLWRGLKAHIFVQKHETHTELGTQSSVLWACVTFQVCTTLKLRSQLYLFLRLLDIFPIHHAINLGEKGAFVTGSCCWNREEGGGQGTRRCGSACCCIHLQHLASDLWICSPTFSSLSLVSGIHTEGGKAPYYEYSPSKEDKWSLSQWPQLRRLSWLVEALLDLCNWAVYKLILILTCLGWQWQYLESWCAPWQPYPCTRVQKVAHRCLLQVQFDVPVDECAGCSFDRGAWH